MNWTQKATSYHGRKGNLRAYDMSMVEGNLPFYDGTQLVLKIWIVQIMKMCSPSTDASNGSGLRTKTKQWNLKGVDNADFVVSVFIGVTS